jgi:hypothetical protein
MSTKLAFGRDVAGYNSFSAPISLDKYSATLTSGGNATLTLPTNVPYWIISFSYQPGSDMWVAYQGNTAAVPAGATFASTNSELLPGSRILPSTYVNSSGVTVANTINVYNNTSSSQDIGIILYANS